MVSSLNASPDSLYRIADVTSRVKSTAGLSEPIMFGRLFIQTTQTRTETIWTVVIVLTKLAPPVRPVHLLHKIQPPLKRQDLQIKVSSLDQANILARQRAMLSKGHPPRSKEFADVLTAALRPASPARPVPAISTAGRKTAGQETPTARLALQVRILALQVRILALQVRVRELQARGDMPPVTMWTLPA